ncbi:MAG: radical SAM protein [Magnetococcus sp. WYHC-3]
MKSDMRTLQGTHQSAQGRHRLGFFEWAVIDTCNLPCHYCVNIGEYSHKGKSRRTYQPGIEGQIAQRLVALAPHFRRMVVNMTGGEPTTARDFAQVLRLLGQTPNIETRLITNLKHAAPLVEELRLLDSILVSVHAGYRTEADIDDMIAVLRALRGHVPRIKVEQVNYQLGPRERELLQRLQEGTGLPIGFQTFMPPWTAQGQMVDADSINRSHFRTTRGKRCALGVFYFMIQANGELDTGLWCHPDTRRRIDLLAPEADHPGAFVEADMAPCRWENCGCNYNYFDQVTYLREALSRGYAPGELFWLPNQRLWPKVRRRLATLALRLRGASGSGGA